MMTQQPYNQSPMRLNDEQKARVVEYMPLVKFIAQRIRDKLPSHIELDDLEHAGMLGLMESVCRFDSEQNNMFKTYAEHRIRGAILDELRKNDWMTRTGREKYKLLEQTIDKLEKANKREATSGEIADALGMKMDEYFSFLNDAKTGVFLSMEEMISRGEARDPSDSSDLSLPEKNLWMEKVKSFLANEIEVLKKDERLVLSLYYFESMTLKEIGQVMDLTESRICQVHNSVMEKLARRLKKKLQEK